MSAAHYKLDNLTVIIDNNGLQIDGSNDEVMSLGDLAAQAARLRPRCHRAARRQRPRGHRSAPEPLTPSPGKPKCILAHTVKGKGVSFMENQVGWHGKAPNEEQRQQALEGTGGLRL